jgi:hypothetical protein
LASEARPDVSESAALTPPAAAEARTLKRASQRLVCDGLTEPLELDAYVTRGTPALESYAKEVELLLDLYQSGACQSGAVKSKVRTRLIEVNTDQLRAKADAEGIGTETFEEGDRTKATVVRGHWGFVLKYRSERAAMTMHPGNYRGLELWLSSKMRELRNLAEKQEVTIGVVTGKQELQLSETRSFGPASMRVSLEGMVTSSFPFYRLQPVDLQGGSAAVPANLRGLIVTQPGEPYTDAELRRIDEFVVSGGKALALYVSAASPKQGRAAMDATLDTMGVERLLAGYGIKLSNDLVLDFGRAASVADLSSGTRTPYPAAAVLGGSSLTSDGSQLDASFPPFYRLPRLSFPFPSSLVLEPSRQPNATLRAVARTSNESIAISPSTINLTPPMVWPAEGARASHVISASVEGLLRSAFATDGAVPTSKQPSRVLVVASSQFLANPFARASHAILPPQLEMMVPNEGPLAATVRTYASDHGQGIVLSFKNTLDWLHLEDDWAELSATVAE